MIATSTNNNSPSSCTLSPSQRPRSKRTPALYAASSNSTSVTSRSSSPRHPSAVHSTGTSSAAAITSPQVLPGTLTSSLSQPRSPRRPTRDSGTQYSPLAFPPTGRASVSRASPPHPQAIPQRSGHQQEPQSARPHSPAAATTVAAADAISTDNLQATKLAVQDPPEPRVRVTPQPPHEGSASTSASASASGPASSNGVDSSAHPGSGTGLSTSTGTAGATGTTGRRTHSSISTPSNDAFTASTSPTKRLRKRNPDATVMPRVYAKCDPKELAVVISDMLLELIRVNDEIPLQDGQLTRFHSRAPPGISVRDYLHRLTYHATLPPPILLAMVTYVDKLCAMFPAFRINSLTVHRFLITAATVASKGLSDSFWTNSTYSKVGGVTIKELALLELELLERVEWRIVPKPEVLEEYYVSLVERSENHILEGSQVAAAATT